MTTTTKTKLIRGIAGVLHTILVLLVVAGLGFQIYAFNEYKNDVRLNREVLCRSPDMAKTEYCTLVAFSNGVKLITKEK